MVRTLFGVLLIVIGVVAFQWHRLEAASEAEINSLSIEEKWKETELGVQDIDNLFSHKNCLINKKYFLSCMNALSTLAEKEGKEITLDGQIKQRVNTDTISEKEKMREWENIFLQSKSIKIPIEKIWHQLSVLIQSHPNVSYRVAQAFNSYLSVFKDPHTYILPKEYYEKVIAQNQNKMNSYGFIVAKLKGKFVFTRIYADSIFEKSGIKKGDILLEVDGIDVSQMGNEELLNLFKGKNKNNFIIMQKEKILKLTLAKEHQVLKSVQYKRWVSENGKTQYQISIYKIVDGVCKETEAILNKVNSQKSASVILDLRDNSGGSMDEVLCVAGLFLGEKKIYDLKYFNKTEAEDFFASNSQIYFGPVAVLINQNTASSAEILAGALQDYKRAEVIGERSFGKGTFQEGEVWYKNPKVLIFQTKGIFSLPSGMSPQIIGILPDIPIESLNLAEGREEDLFYSPVKNVTGLNLVALHDYNNEHNSGSRYNNDPGGELQTTSRTRLGSEGNLEKNSKMTSERKSKRESCEGLFNESLTEDPQLGKAQSHLSCS